MIKVLLALTYGFFLGYFVIPYFIEPVFQVRLRMPAVIPRLAEMMVMVLFPRRSSILLMQQHYFQNLC